VASVGVKKKNQKKKKNSSGQMTIERNLMERSTTNMSKKYGTITRVVQKVIGRIAMIIWFSLWCISGNVKNCRHKGLCGRVTYVINVSNILNC
jgi:hypothetical protein